MRDIYLSIFAKENPTLVEKLWDFLNYFHKKKTIVCKDTSHLLHAQNFTGKIKFHLFVDTVCSELFWMKMYAVKSFTIINPLLDAR